MASTIKGIGDRAIAHDLYRSAVLTEVSAMRREGVFVCFANIQARMSTYHQEILWTTLWSVAREGLL